MDPILYNAASGGRTNFKRQEILANNLANSNTPGFKADLYQAQTLYAQGEGGSFGPSFAVQADNAVDLTTGDLLRTGNNMDIAVKGDGWFAVRDSKGQEAYTKAGSLRVNTNGQLITSSGKVVVGNGGPISIPPAKSVDIGSDGTISIVPIGSEAKNATVIERIKMVSLDNKNLMKNGDGLFQLKNGGKAPADNSLRLISGALEGSNVQAVEQMVSMITSGRDFESHMTLMSTISENFQKLTQVLHE